MKALFCLFFILGACGKKGDESPPPCVDCNCEACQCSHDGKCHCSKCGCKHPKDNVDSHLDRDREGGCGGGGCSHE